MLEHGSPLPPFPEWLLKKDIFDELRETAIERGMDADMPDYDRFVYLRGKLDIGKKKEIEKTQKKKKKDYVGKV